MSFLGLFFVISYTQATLHKSLWKATLKPRPSISDQIVHARHSNPCPAARQALLLPSSALPSPSPASATISPRFLSGKNVRVVVDLSHPSGPCCCQESKIVFKPGRRFRAALVFTLDAHHMQWEHGHFSLRKISFQMFVDEIAAR